MHEVLRTLPYRCNARCMTTDTDTGRVPAFDLADRLRKSLRVADVSVNDMADYLEVSRNTVGRWINGHAAPSGPVVRAWAMRTGVPYAWLRYGIDPNGGPGGRPRQDSNLQPTGRVFPLVSAGIALHNLAA